MANPTRSASFLALVHAFIIPLVSMGCRTRYESWFLDFWKSAANLSGMVAICYNDVLRCFLVENHVWEKEMEMIFFGEKMELVLPHAWQQQLQTRCFSTGLHDNILRCLKKTSIFCIYSALEFCRFQPRWICCTRSMCIYVLAVQGFNRTDFSPGSIDGNRWYRLPWGAKILPLPKLLEGNIDYPKTWSNRCRYMMILVHVQ